MNPQLLEPDEDSLPVEHQQWVSSAMQCYAEADPDRTNAPLTAEVRANLASCSGAAPELAKVISVIDATSSSSQLPRMDFELVINKLVIAALAAVPSTATTTVGETRLSPKDASNELRSFDRARRAEGSSTRDHSRDHSYATSGAMHLREADHLAHDAVEARIRNELLKSSSAAQFETSGHLALVSEMPAGFDGYGQHCGVKVIEADDLPLQSSSLHWQDTLAARISTGYNSTRSYLDPPREEAMSVIKLYKRYSKMGGSPAMTMSTGNAAKSCTFDELAKQNETMGLKEFTRLLADHGVVPLLMRQEMVRQLFVASAIKHRVHLRLDIWEFQVALQLCIDAAIKSVNIEGPDAQVPRGLLSLAELVQTELSSIHNTEDKTLYSTSMQVGILAARQRYAEQRMP